MWAVFLCPDRTAAPGGGSWRCGGSDRRGPCHWSLLAERAARRRILAPSCSRRFVVSIRDYRQVFGAPSATVVDWRGRSRPDHPIGGGGRLVAARSNGAFFQRSAFSPFGTEGVAWRSWSECRGESSVSHCASQQAIYEEYM